MNNHYTYKSFETCDFHPLKDGKMLMEYPILSEIVLPEWSKDPQLDSLIRYTIMIYDPKSALVIGERDLNYRKGIAAELAGFDVSEISLMDAIYTCNYPNQVEYTVRYLMRFVKSKEWAAICAYQYKFWEAIKLIMKPIDMDKSDREQLDAANKKDVLSASIDEGLIKLDSYYKTFFGDDDELEKKAKKRMTPELMAAKKNVL
jgi:hypothetical protein